MCTMNDELRMSVSDYFDGEAGLRAEPVSPEEIANLEKWIGFSLPESYKWFVETFGGGIVGNLEICGLRRAPTMGNLSASAERKTSFFRKQSWPGTENWLVISSDGYGNPIGIDKAGRVWISEFDFGGIRLLATNFDNFLKGLLPKQ